MATSTTKYVLTDEHRAQLAPTRDRAIALALRTEPQTDDDRAKVRVAMAGMYAAANLPAPERGVFVGSPITAAIAWVVASAAWWLRDNPSEHTKLFSRAVTESEIMAAIPIACHRAVATGMAAVLGEPIPDLGPLPKVAATYAATRAATEAATVAATEAATRAATRAATYAATDAATEAATRAATSAATRAATRAATYAATDAATSAATVTVAATDAATRAATSAATYAATDAATEAATRAATSAATDAATRAATRAATYAATSAATVAATDAATDAATRAATSAATYAATDAATEAATRAATSAATDAATRAATRAATYAATSAATVAATDAATRAATYAATSAATVAATRAAKGVASATSNAIAAFMLQCMPLWYRGWQGGNFWAGWAAFLSFFRDVAKLDLPIYTTYAHFESLTIHAGPRFVHAKFWIASDFPTRIGRDAENRAHSDTGPQLEWSDGWKSYSVHGVRVPAWIVEHPERITVDVIDRENNAEIRRIMIAQFGLAKYAAAGEVVHEDEHVARRPDGSEYRSKRTLMRRRFNDETPDLLICMVKNSTPEPDGSIKNYALRIHPECRPMWVDDLTGEPREGEPQKLTCQNAVASTFGLRGEQYAPEVET